MRRFTVYRPAIPTETHDEFQRNAPDLPQYEGVIFTDGTVALRWLTACVSTSVWACLDDMLRIHGHQEYGTRFEWHDGEPAMPQWWHDKAERARGDKAGEAHEAGTRG